ncbi:hypothetical protein KEM55_002319, partial [Ascosphaera atra]
TPEFKTDTDISAGKTVVGEKPLQRWQPGPDEGADLSLESAGSTAGWDQFAANERLFGAKSTWDENLYTTRIDRNSPSYKQKAAEAAKIAREIEQAAVSNAHMREERGLAVEQDFDEEARYSGVQRGTEAPAAAPKPTKTSTFPNLRSGGADRYTPPARRAPSGTATSAVPTGVHADPAIISATMARPESLPKQPTQTPAQAAVPTPLSQPAASTAPTPASQEAQEKTAPAPPKPERALKAEGLSQALRQQQQPTKAPNASTRVESEVLENFKKFANNEKLKVQERRRNQASHDRTIRLNELMKFSQNFKLGTPVPDDLVPILAKDPSKQEAIIEKARRQYEEKKNAMAAKTAGSTPSTAGKPSAPQPATTGAPSQAAAAPAGPSTTAAASAAPTPEAPIPSRPVSGAPGSFANDRPPYGRGRGFPPGGPQMGGRPMSFQPSHNGRPNSGHLSHRLANIQAEMHQQHKVRGNGGYHNNLPPSHRHYNHRHQNHPHPPPHSQTQDSRSRFTPLPYSTADNPHFPKAPMAHAPVPPAQNTSKYNVRAMEFRPNPNASAFTPGGAPPPAPVPIPSPAVPPVRVPATPTPASFWGNKKPMSPSQRPSIKDHFDTLKRLREQNANEASKAANMDGAAPARVFTTYPPSYRTLPTWDTAQANENKTYKDMFKNALPQGQPRASPNGPVSHQPHMQYPLQQGTPMLPHAMAPHVTPHLHPQPYHPGPPMPFDDHTRMMQSPSTSAPYQSPRLQQTPMAYPPPMGAPPAQLAYNAPVPGFYNQPAPMRYPGAPPFNAPQHPMNATPVMMQPPTSGPYMGLPQAIPTPYNPQLNMYALGPANAYMPQGAPPPAPPATFPSPGRPAPMMMHQGSQQGLPPQPGMFMNGQHPQSPFPSQPTPHMPAGRPAYPPPPPPPQAQQPHFSTSPQHHPPPPHQQQQHRDFSNNAPQAPPSGPAQHAPVPVPATMPPQGGPPTQGAPVPPPTNAEGAK